MRRSITVALIVIPLVLPLRLLSQAAGSDEIRIRELIAAHQRASERSDLRGLVDLYSEDAELVSSTGARRRGRKAIEEYYRSVVESAITKSGRHHTHPIESIQIRFVTPDVALVDVASVTVGGIDSTGKAMPASSTNLATVWRKERAGWVVVEQRSLVAPRTAPQQSAPPNEE